METRGGILQPTSRRVFQIDPGEDSIVAVNFSTRPKTIRVRVLLDSRAGFFDSAGAYSLRGNARHSSRPARSNRSATRAKKRPHSDR